MDQPAHMQIRLVVYCSYGHIYLNACGAHPTRFSLPETSHIKQCNYNSRQQTTLSHPTSVYLQRYNGLCRMIER